jgi:hypothetical protein
MGATNELLLPERYTLSDSVRMVATKDVHFCSELVKTAGVIGDKPSHFVPKDQVTETHS